MAKRDTRIGCTFPGHGLVPAFLKRLRPIHLIGIASPSAVTTRSPITRSSTWASPFEVRMFVPRRKHGTVGVAFAGLELPTIGKLLSAARAPTRPAVAAATLSK